MNNGNYKQLSLDYERIEKVIGYLDHNFKSGPALDEIARTAGLSKHHFIRVFKRWAGISPVQFRRFLTLDYAKRKLAESHNLLDTSYDSGLSGPGRLHDLFVTLEAVTPGEYKSSGEGVKIGYGFHPTPFGECLIAVTARGICHLGFEKTGTRAKALAILKENWANAVFCEDNTGTEKLITDIFAKKAASENQPFHLLLKGTNFQVNVWRALLTIPRGTVVSYGDIARLIGNPGSYRATASAIAQNPVAFLIPCHRVITSTGKVNRYRWGETRKKAILGWEASLSESR